MEMFAFLLLFSLRGDNEKRFCVTTFYIIFIEIQKAKHSADKKILPPLPQQMWEKHTNLFD